MYLVGLHVYYKMIHGPYNLKWYSVVQVVNLETERTRGDSERWGCRVYGENEKEALDY